jgi:hypothetical protein
LWHGTARKDGTDCHGGAPTDLPGWHFCWDDGILFVRSNCLSGLFLFLLSWMATGIFLLKSVKKILATWLQVRPCFVRSIPLFIVIFTTMMEMQFWCTPHFQRVTHICQSGFIGTDGTYMHEDDRRRLEEGAAIAAVQL